MKNILKQVYGVELASQKVELGIIDDLLSNVNANATGMDKARPLIRQAFKDIAAAIDIYNRVDARNKKIDKLQKSFKSSVDKAGLTVNDLADQRMKNAYNGLYVTDVTQDIKGLKSAISGLKNSGEI